MLSLTSLHLLLSIKWQMLLQTERIAMGIRKGFTVLAAGLGQIVKCKQAEEGSEETLGSAPPWRVRGAIIVWIWSLTPLLGGRIPWLYGNQWISCLIKNSFMRQEDRCDFEAQAGLYKFYSSLSYHSKTLHVNTVTENYLAMEKRLRTQWLRTLTAFSEKSRFNSQHP